MQPCAMANRLGPLNDVDPHGVSGGKRPEGHVDEHDGTALLRASESEGQQRYAGERRAFHWQLYPVMWAAFQPLLAGGDAFPFGPGFEKSTFDLHWFSNHAAYVAEIGGELVGMGGTCANSRVQNPLECSN